MIRVSMSQACGKQALLGKTPFLYKMPLFRAGSVFCLRKKPGK
jgi:hypothetical protein